MSAPAPSLFTHAAETRMREMGIKTGKANLEVFAATLAELARGNRHVLAVTSDSRGSGKLVPFAAEFPKQIVEVGIAEQNLVGVAAGLASAGKVVFAVSPACFLTARSFEQIKNDVAYSNNPVKLIGISSGVSYGALGTTHHSLHDLAALRAVNNLQIIVPADNFETREAILAVAKSQVPVFVRFGKAAMPNLHATGATFEIGKAIVLREGRDVAFIATGETVIHALLAAAELEREGVSCSVLSVHSIKPLDDEAILRVASKSKAVVTVEEHMILGGLGEACAGLLMEAGVRVAFKRMGIPDEYTVTGAQADIFRHYGLSMEGLAEAGRKLMQRGCG